MPQEEHAAEGIEFEFGRVVKLVSRVKRRGRSLYVPIPAEDAEASDLKEGDVVVVILSKIKGVKLLPKR
jgi:bifunctional DNA-binding transcriptional regulator/antitoxin component of YhaV-PrlF toxin-antitoxin module